MKLVFWSGIATIALPLLIGSLHPPRLRAQLQMLEVRYEVAVGAHGTKLERAKFAEQNCTESVPFGGAGCHQFQGGAGRGIRGLAVDMSDLAAYVSNWSDRPVVDQTGLKGLYAVQTEGWTSSDDDLPRRTLDEVLDRLGLKLVRKKAPLEIFVIEHVEKPSAH